MKKMCLTLALTLCAFCALSAAETFPGWLCTDKAAAEAALANAQNPYQKTQCQVLLAIQGKTFGSFAELRSTVEAVVSASELAADRRISFLRDHCKIIAWNQKLHIAEAYAWAKLNPSKYDLCVYENWSKHLGLSDTEVYTGFMRCLTSGEKYNPTLLKVAVAKLIEAAPAADVSTQKEDLQRLNRQFSPYLVTDKSNYEPIIVMIRTALETY